MGHGILAAGGRPPEQVACALVLDAGTELNLAIPFVQLGQVVGANSDCGGVVDKSTPVAGGRRHAAVQRHQSMRLPRVIHHHQKGERERPGHLPVTRLLLLLRHVLVEPPAINLGCARRRRSGGASRDGTRLLAPWRNPLRCACQRWPDGASLGVLNLPPCASSQLLLRGPNHATEGFVWGGESAGQGTPRESSRGSKRCRQEQNEQ
jgi:hypothetical protein